MVVRAGLLNHKRGSFKPSTPKLSLLLTWRALQKAFLQARLLLFGVFGTRH